MLAVKHRPARAFYEAEALRGGWTSRQLDRQIQSQFYERTALSRNKAALLRKGVTTEDAVTPEQEIKDPYVLEFLALKDEYSESDLESALIAQLEAFLLELGGDFTFAGDAGQMHLYLNYAREHWTLAGENPPVGLILCAEKDHAVAKYALEGLPNKVLAAEYRTTLPAERVLVAEIEKTRLQIEARRQAGQGTARRRR